MDSLTEYIDIGQIEDAGLDDIVLAVYEHRLDAVSARNAWIDCEKHPIEFPSIEKESMECV